MCFFGEKLPWSDVLCKRLESDNGYINTYVRAFFWVLLSDLNTIHWVIVAYNRQPWISAFQLCLSLPSTDTRDSIWPFILKHAWLDFTTLPSPEREAGGHGELAPGIDKSRASCAKRENLFCWRLFLTFTSPNWLETQFSGLPEAVLSV